MKHIKKEKHKDCFRFQVSSFKNKGFIFLEVLIAVALISVVFIVLLGIGASSLNISSSIQKTTRADSLVKEELEATRSFRDGTTWSTNGLGTVLVGSASPYYLVLDTITSPPKWKLQAGTETVDGFTRNVVFDKVSRDPSTKNIEAVYNPLRDDPDTRKITVTVASSDRTYQVITYLTNWNK